MQSSILDDIYSDREEVLASQADKNIIKNPAVREAAVRFVRDRLGRKDLSEDEAVDEYIEHFREFGVNELVAGGDYNYVSAAANDATGGTNLDNDARERAGQRLSDYRLLYQTYNEMPAFSDGFWKATGDYTEGLLKAPSTYVGLLLPGIGKGSGVAATQAAKIGVQRTLMQALKTPVSTIANKAVANPLKTTMFVEGSAASLQNIAQQKTEMELDLSDDYSYSETGLVFGVGAAAPIAVAPNAIKGLVTDVVEEGSEELSETAQKAVAKKNEEATIKAEKVLKENNVLAEQVSSTLRPLDPEKVKAGREKFADIADEKGISQIGDKEGLAKTLGAKEEDISITSDFVLSLDKSRTKRIFGASVEILAKSDDGLLENERITEGVARVIRGMNDKKTSAGDKFYKDILEKYNLTSDDFANMFMADVSDAARLLQQAGAAKKTLEGAENKIFTRLNAVAALVLTFSLGV